MNRSSSLPSRSSTPSAAYRAEVSSRAASTTDISTASRSNSESSAVPTSISRRKRSSDVWRGDWSEESIPPIIHLFRSQIQVRRPGRDDRTATTSTCRYYRDGTVLLRGAGEQQDGEETEAGRERARALVLTLLRRWYEGGDGQVEHPATAYRLKYPDRLWAGVAEGQVADQRRDEETHSHQARPTGDSADCSPPLPAAHDELTDAHPLAQVVHCDPCRDQQPDGRFDDHTGSDREPLHQLLSAGTSGEHGHLVATRPVAAVVDLDLRPLLSFPPRQPPTVDEEVEQPDREKAEAETGGGRERRDPLERLRKHLQGHGPDQRSGGVAEDDRHDEARRTAEERQQAAEDRSQPGSTRDEDDGQHRLSLPHPPLPRLDDLGREQRDSGQRHRDAQLAGAQRHRRERLAERRRGQYGDRHQGGECGRGIQRPVRPHPQEEPVAAHRIDVAELGEDDRREGHRLRRCVSVCLADQEGGEGSRAGREPAQRQPPAQPLSL